MRKYIAAISIALVMCVAFTLEANAGQARQPIKIYRTLYRTSNILFWETTKKTNLLIKIYDKNQDGDYDSYLWYEDGQAIHKGQFFTNMEPDKFKNKLINESKNGFEAYYKEGSDSYSFKIPSRMNNSINGILNITADFSHNMVFDFVRDDNYYGKIIPIVPPKESYNYRLDYKFKVKKVNDSYSQKVEIENHEIIILDDDKDGYFDSYFYFINDFPFVEGRFRTILDIQSLLKRFHEDAKQNNITFIERNNDKIRIGIESKFDGKSFGFLEVNIKGDHVLSYSDYPAFSNPYVTISEKLGVSLYPNPCNDYITLVTGGLLNSQATIDLYQNNLFLQNYFSGVIQEAKMKFDVSGFTNGLYQFIITFENEIIFPMPFIIHR